MPTPEAARPASRTFCALGAFVVSGVFCVPKQDEGLFQAFFLTDELDKF